MKNKELNIEDLKKVAGGTKQEWDELKEIVLANPKLKSMYDQYKLDPYFEDDEEIVAEILYEIWDISTGYQDDAPNIYEYGDYTHDQIKEMFRSYK